jgi:Raf kinase inhibitor-like YbhB/YbcL family protein
MAALAAAAFLALCGAALPQTFSLTSATVKPGILIPDEHILTGFGCTGGNLSPPLSWSGAPPQTKSFVLTMFDPDAPTGSGFWHRLVVNIPPTAAELPRGAGNTGVGLPAGALQTRTDFGKPGYGGPCPPAGSTDNYRFTLFALDVDKLDVTADTSAAMIGFQLHFHAIANATLVAPYKH